MKTTTNIQKTVINTFLIAFETKTRPDVLLAMARLFADLTSDVSLESHWTDIAGMLSTSIVSHGNKRLPKLVTRDIEEFLSLMEYQVNHGIWK
jgi:hypothetical protein